MWELGGLGKNSTKPPIRNLEPKVHFLFTVGLLSVKAKVTSPYLRGLICEVRF